MDFRAWKRFLTRRADSSRKIDEAARRLEAAERRRRRRGVVEPLEQRLLFATINYVVDDPQNYLVANPAGLADGDVDLLIRVADVGGVPTLQLVDLDLAPGGQVVGAAPMTGPIDVHVTGFHTTIQGHDEEFPESLVVDLSNNTGLIPPSVPLVIDFDGYKGTAVGLIQDDVLTIAPSAGSLYQPDDLSVTLSNGEKMSVLGAVAAVHDVALTVNQGSLEVLGAGTGPGNNGSIAAGGNVNLAALSTVTAQSDAASADALAMPTSELTITSAAISGVDVTLTASAVTDVTITAYDLRDGQFSVGGVVAISNATVVIDGATHLVAAGNLSISAVSDVTTNVTRGAQDDGDANDDDKDQDAALAVSAVTSTAGVRLSDTAALSTAGTAAVTASNVIRVTTLADGTLHEGNSGGTDAGGTVATATVVGDTEVLVEDAVSIVAGGDLTIGAVSDRSITTTAKATAGGAAEDGDANTQTQGQQTLAANNASTSDGAVTLAAAIAVNTVMGETRTRITGGSLTSTGGAIAIASSASHDVQTVADGTTTLGGDESGVGVAVAIGLAGVTDPNGAKALRSTAEVSGSVSLHAATVSIESQMPQGKFTTDAKSGLSGPSQDENGDSTGADIGAAGALAIGVTITDSRATLAPNAQVDASGADLTLHAQANSHATVNALPKVEGNANVGIGAAVALNITDHVTRAAIEKNASVSGVHDLTVTSNSFHNVDTLTKTGAAGGTAVAAGVSLSLGNHDTQAEIASQGQLSTSGSVVVGASDFGITKTKSEGDASGQGDAAIGAAFSLNLLEDRVDAAVNRNLSAGGAVNIFANGTSTSQANAKASAKGEKSESDADSKNKPNEQANNQRAAGNSQASSRGARDSSNSTANPDASTSEGDLTVAAALALNIAHSRSRSTIADGVQVDADGRISVLSQANTDASAIADGSAANGDVTIGAAVAINSANVENLATVGTGAQLTADGLSVQALSNDSIHLLQASATSGAGGGDVGLAGALALNLTHVTTVAKVESGATAVIVDGSDDGASVGAVQIQAIAVTDSQAAAKAKADGGDAGIGASVAFNINDETTRALLDDDAQFAKAEDLTVYAQSKHDVKTEATGGATGGAAITPVATLTFAFPTTEARIGQQAGTLGVTGDVVVQAVHSGTVDADANGKSEGSDAAIGASLGFTYMKEHVLATVERSLEADGAVTITSRSTSTHTADAVASAAGAQGEKNNQGGTAQDKTNNLRSSGNDKSQANSQQDSGTDNKATASTADNDQDGNGDAVTVAAAISVNVVEGESRASIADGLTIHAGGLLTVRSSQNLDDRSTANGTASKGSVGIGAAVSINVVDIDNTATIGLSDVTADGLVVEALMAHVPGESPDAHDFKAEAKSGAGGDDVGVAGSLAINHIELDTLATVPTGASVTLADGPDVGGSVGPVSIKAQANTTDTAHALPDVPGGGAQGDVGVGASVAINLTYVQTTAEIGDGVAWNGAAGASSVVVDASADHLFSTDAQNGAKGGDVGVGGAVGVVISKNHTLAQVGGGAGALNSAGAASITAHHGTTLTTTVGSAATGGDAAIGASVGVVLVEDTSDAILSRDLTAGGDVIVRSDLDAHSDMNVKASAGGGGDGDGDSSNDATADQEASKQAQQDNAGGTSNAPPKAADSSDQANQETKEEGNSSSGGVGAAATVAINSLSLKNNAAIIHGADVTTPGTIQVGAPAHVVSHTQADSTAVDSEQNISVGAAVALNWVSLTNNASVGAGSTLSGGDLVVEAVTTGNQTNDYTATAFAIAGNTGDAAVAGVLALNVVDADTTATTADDSHLLATGDVTVSAEHAMRTQAAAIAGAVSEGVSVAAAASINILGLDELNETGGSTTVASIGDANADGAGASVQAGGAVAVTAVHSIGMFPTLDLPETLNQPKDPKYAIADIDIPLASVAVSGGGTTGDFAGAGSAGINLHETSTWAIVDRQAIVGGKSLDVSAADTSDLATMAGAIGVSSGGVGIGLGLDLNILHKDTLASIGRGAEVTTDASLQIHADSTETLTSVGATAGVGNSVGGAASAAVQVIETTTHAAVEDGTDATDHATLVAGGPITVSAHGSLDTKLIAGSVGAGGTAGIGAANTTLVHTDAVEARVGDWTEVNSQGRLAVHADSTETYLTIGAAGAAGGSGSFAGAAVVNILNETTHATVGEHATLQIGDGVKAGAPGVEVTAQDVTTDVSVGGSLSASGGVSAGIGADVATLSKSTIASIGSGVTAPIEGDLRVDAQSVEDVTSAVGGLAASSNVALTLDANVHVYDITTRAFIGDDPRDKTVFGGTGDVHAGGNVVISADDRTEIDKVVGSVAVSGTAAFGAAAAVTTVNKSVEAFVGDGAKVTGDGKTSATSVRTGKFTESYQAASKSTDGIESNSTATLDADAGSLSAQGEVGLPDLTDVSTDTHDDGQDAATDESLTQQRVVAPALKGGFHGVAITATNRDDIEDYTISLAGGTAAFAISAGVNVLDVNTRAFVGTGAKINESTAGANPDQDVLVAAGSDFAHVNFGGSVAAGQVGIGPAAAISTINEHTEARIGWDAEGEVATAATANARRDVTVRATATEDVLLVGVGLAGGWVGIGAGVDVLGVNGTTIAEVGPGSHVLAEGNVAVSATDDTDLDVIAAGVGVGGFGGGGGVGVIALNKHTQALLGDGATVDALAKGDAVSGVFDGTVLNDGGSFETAAVRGVIVQAHSTENVLHLALAAAGGVVGAAGGVTVTMIDSDTTAEIGADAQVNQTQNNAAATSLQQVYVNAANEARVTSFAGAAAGGLGAVGGAVDFGTLNNDTYAHIGDGAEVRARGNVDVNALAIKDLDGFTLSGAGGVVALTGAVSVWSIGTPLQESYANEEGKKADASEDENGKSSTADATSQVQTGRDGLTSSLGNFAHDPQSNDKSNANRIRGVGQSAAGRLSQGLLDKSAIDQQLNGASQNRGTVAEIGFEAHVVAGLDVEVQAKEDLEFDVNVGGFAAGLGGVGAGIGVYSIAANTRATSAGTIDAGDQVVVQATLDEDVKPTAVAGSAGFVGLGAAVVDLQDHSHVTAEVADVDSAASVTVLAKTDQWFPLTTGQASVGGVAANASFTNLRVDGETTAAVLPQAEIGQAAGKTVGSLSVKADSTIDAHDRTVAIAGGAAAFSANFAFADVAPTVAAEIGFGSQVDVSGAAVVRATAAHDVEAQVDTFTGGAVTVGASIAKATLGGRTRADVETAAQVTAGSITVDAQQNHDGIGPTSDGACAHATAPGAVPGISAGAGTFSTAEANTDVEVQVGDDVQLTSTAGAILLRAFGGHRADAEGLAVSVGLGAAAGVTESHAHADGKTRVDVAGSLDSAGAVTTLANAYNAADAHGEAAAGGLGAGGVGVSSESSASPVVESLVYGGKVDAVGAISVLVNSTNVSSATGDGGAFGGGVGIGIIETSATSNGQAKSLMASDVDGTSLLVKTTAGNTTDAHGQSAVGGIGGAANGVTATVDNQPEFRAQMLGKVRVATTAEVGVEATNTVAATTETIAVAAGATGGGAAAETTSRPLVETLASGSSFTAPTSLNLYAHDTSHVTTDAGAATVGGGAYGASSAVNDIAAHVSASLIHGVHGTNKLTVEADETAAVSGNAFGLAAGGFAGAGGKVVNSIANQVQAQIADDVFVNSNSPGTGDVAIRAHDTTDVTSHVDLFGIAALATAGAGATYTHVANDVVADVSNLVLIKTQGDVEVIAREEVDVHDVAVGRSVALGAGVAGNTAVNVIENDVRASVADDAVLQAGNNVLVQAEQDVQLTSAAAAAAGGLFGDGGTVIVNTFENTTRAYVDDNSSVRADGIGASRTIPQWDETTGAKSNAALDGLAVIAHSTVHPADDPDGSGPLAPSSAVAYNRVGGFTGLSSLNVVNTIADVTEAFIARSTVNNQADPGNEVIVRAHADEQLELTLDGTAGGVEGVGGAVNRAVIASVTRAFISDRDESGQSSSEQAANVYGKSIEVNATSRESIDLDVLGVTGGLFSLAGSIAVTEIQSHTEALIRDSHVSSTGDLLVRADDTATIDGVVSTASVGALAGGASISVNSIENTVRSQVLGGHLVALKNLEVKADSDEVIDVQTRSLGAGLVALAGTVGLNTIETTTEALVADGDQHAEINQELPPLLGAPPSQQVTIDADDRARITNHQGTIAGSLVAGAGASVEFGDIRSRTVAEAGEHSKIYSAHDLTVNSHSDRTLDSNVTAFGGGAIGLAGSLSLLTLGELSDDDVTQVLKQFLTEDEDGHSLLDQTEGPAKNQDVTDAISDGATDSAAIAQLAANRVAALGSLNVQDTVDSNLHDRVTAAFVENAGSAASGTQLVAGGNVTITATNEYEFTQTAGSESYGLGAVGATIATAQIRQATDASLGDHGSISATGNVVIGASDGNKAGTPIAIHSFGQQAGLVAIGVNEATLTLDGAATARIGQGARIELAEAVSVTAAQQAQIEAKGVGFAAGAAAAGDVNVTVTDTAVAAATVDDSAHVGVQRSVASLLVSAGAHNTIDNQAKIGHAALGGDESGGHSTTTLSPTAVAHVGAATIDARHAVTVTGDVQNVATGNVDSLSIKLIGSGAGISHITIQGGAAADVDDGATIDAESLAVTTSQVSTADATGNAIGGGLGGGQAAVADVSIDMNSAANIGDAKVTTDRDVLVSSVSNVSATTHTGTIAIEGVGEGGSQATVSIAGEVAARIGAGAEVDAGGNVKVDAYATNSATSDATATSGGLVNGGAAETRSKVDVDTLAQVTGATIYAVGPVQVESTATNTADADSKGYTMSVVGAVGFVKSEALVEGSTRAKADGSLHSTGSFLRVQALDQDSHATATAKAAGGGIGLSQQASTATAYVRPSDDDAEAQVRARLAGDVSAAGALAVRAKTENAYATSIVRGVSIAGGVASGGTNAQAELGQTVRASIGDGSVVTSGLDLKVEALNDSDWSTATAEAVGGALLAGFTGAKAAARSIDDVKAIIGDADVTAGGQLRVYADSTNLSSATGDGIAIGGLLGVGDVQADATSGDETVAGVENGATLHATDLVVESIGRDRAKTDVTGTGGGLVSDQSTVAASHVSPKISAYLADGVQATATHDARVTADARTEGDAESQANTFGAVALGESRSRVDLKPNVETRIGMNSHLDAGNDVILEALFGQQAPPDGSGISHASAFGAGAGAFFGIVGSKSEVDAAPQTILAVDQRTTGNTPSVHAGRDATIRSDAATSIYTESRNFSLSLGASHGRTDAYSDLFTTSTANVANGAEVVADRDLTISSASDDEAQAFANAAAGSLVESGARALSRARVDHQTKSTLESGAKATAGRTLDLNSDASAQGVSHASADSGSISGSSNANAGFNSQDLDVGGANWGVVITGSATTTVGQNAALKGRVVNVGAVIGKSDGESISNAHTLAAGADIDGLSRVELYDDAQVDVQAGATLAGVQQVNLRAETQAVKVNSDTVTKVDGAGGATSDAIGHVDVDATVTTAPGSLITTHDLTVRALGVTGSHPFWTNGTATGTVNDAHEKGDYDPDRVVRFDADVVLKSGAATLVVGPSGEVLARDGVTFSPHNAAGNVDPAATTIVVDPIVNNHPGSALFQTNSLGSVTYGDPNNGPTKSDAAPSGYVWSLATFQKTEPLTITFRETLDAVHIENQSNKNLSLSDIQVVNSTVKPEVTIDTDRIQGVDPQDPSKMIDIFGFDIVQSFEPTKIEILQTNVAAGKDVALNGVIDNPLGTTIIRNQGDDVLMGNGSAMIRGQVIDVDAHGDIGSAATRLKVDLIASPGRPEQDPAALDPSPGFRAGAEVWLDVRGVDRDPSIANFQVEVGQISGSNVDVALRTAIKETTMSANAFLVDVEVKPAAAVGYENHFRPDGSGPAANLPPGVFGTGAANVDATYALPLVIASGNVKITSAVSPKKIHVDADVNLLGAGKVDVSTSGDVDLTETVGALQVGLVQANGGHATLTALTGDIVDKDNDAAADILANHVTLHAAQGAIGSAANPLDINSSLGAPSEVNAAAPGAIVLVETNGDLNVGVITSGQDVSLATNSGAIVDKHDDGLLNVGGKNLTLTAKGAATGKLGETADALEVCATGTLSLLADAGVENVKNLCGPLKIKFVQVGAGNVSIADAGNIELVDGAQILAAAGVNLEAGGGVLLAPTAQVSIGGVFSVHAGSNAAPGGVGADVTLDGTMQAARVDVFGGSGHDHFHLKHKFARGTTEVFAGAGNDTIDGASLVDRLFAHGGLGDDAIVGGSASDRLWGDEGNDQVSGGGGNDALIGDDGDDVLNGDDGRDLLFGGLGLDVLNGGSGDDVVIGCIFRNSGNGATLDALLTAWGQNKSYSSRVTQLGKLGLKSSNIADDKVKDQVLGGADTDWFWTFGADTSDRGRGERQR